MNAKAKLINVLAVPALVGVALVLPSSAVAATSAHSTVGSATVATASYGLPHNAAGMNHMHTFCYGEEGI